MPTYIPIASLALLVPNASFAVPGASGKAAGWTFTSLTATSLYGDGPTLGHHRAQRISLSSGTGTLVSSPAPSHQLCLAGAQNVRAVLHLRTTNLNGNGTVRVNLENYSAAGALLTSEQVLLTSANTTGWEVLAVDATPTIPANTSHHRIKITLTRTAGTPVVDLAFVAIGAYSASAGSVTLPMPVYPGTAAVTSQPTQTIWNANGTRRRLDFTRYRGLRRGTMRWEAISASDASVLRFLHLMNRGTSLDDAAAWPGGGSFPILLETNTPTWPAVIPVDFDDDDLAVIPWGPGNKDLWELTANLTEAIL